MRIFLFIVGCLIIQGCASQAQKECKPTLATDRKPEIFADEVNRAQLIGRWLGESDVKDGAKIKWLTERSFDGLLRVHFKVTGPDGKTEEQIETGLWGFAGGIYFAMIRAYVRGGEPVPVDVTDATFYDAYKALQVSPSEFTYMNLSTQEQFTVKKVGSDFRF